MTDWSEVALGDTVICHSMDRLARNLDGQQGSGGACCGECSGSGGQTTDKSAA
jgi:hypothetical protein